MTTRDDFHPRKCDSFAIPTQLTRADSSDDKEEISIQLLRYYTCVARSPGVRMIDQMESGN